MAKQNVKLTETNGFYDIKLDSDGDIETEDSFDSIIITSLFTDARADKDQVTNPENRRGWIGNTEGGFILGSTIWVYGQMRNRNVEFTEVASEARFSLQHLLDDNLVHAITSKMSLDNGKAVLDIQIERPNDRISHRFYNLWENTGAQ